MNKIIAILILLFSQCASAKIYIRYLNGALNSSESSSAPARVKFESIIRDSGWTGNNVIFMPLINKRYSAFPDIVVYQQELSSLAYNNSKTYPSENKKIDFYSELAKIYKGNSSNGVLIQTLAVMSTVNFFFASVKKQLLSGDKVIIVAHSQGNLYAEAISALVSEDKYIPQALKNNYKVVSLGAVSSSTNNDRYINVWQDDTIYNNGYPMYGMGGVARDRYMPLSANYSACFLLPCLKEGDSVEKLQLKLKSTHTALEMYLNDDVYVMKYPGISANVGITSLVSKMVTASIIETRLSNKISIASHQSTTGLLEKFMAFFVRPAYAQNSQSNLAVDINSTFFVTAEGAEFSGNEAIAIEGATCDISTIQKSQGAFTQKCTSGNSAGLQNKIRVYDTKFDADLTIDENYKYITIRGPVISPLAPTLTDLGSGSVRVSWASVSGAGTYEVYRGQTLISTTASTSIDDAGQTPGSEVCYRVRAIANGVASAYSPQQCITPAAPKCANQWTTGYTSAGGTENGTQSCPAGQVGSIALSHTCSPSGVWGATTTKNTCAVVPVSCKGTWTSASYSVGQTETSNQACSTGYSGQTTQSHVCQPNGSWGTTSTNNGCVLAVCNGSWTGQQYSVGQTEEQFTNTCPTGSTGQVRQFHTCQSGGTWTPTANSDNCTATLGVPQNLLASVVSSGIQLTWSSVPGATGYRIYRNNDTSGAYYNQIGTATTYIDSGVVNGQAYTYAVAAQSNLSGTLIISNPSSWVSKTYTSGQTAVATPTGFSVSRLSSGLRLVWNASPGADSYLIYRYDNRPNAFLAPVGAVTFFDDTLYSSQGLVSGISYCYKIAAQKGSNTSPMTDYGCAYAP